MELRDKKSVRSGHSKVEPRVLKDNFCHSGVKIGNEIPEGVPSKLASFPRRGKF